MYCTKCGNQMPDNARFCSGCGNAVQPTQNANQKIRLHNSPMEMNAQPVTNPTEASYQNATDAYNVFPQPASTNTDGIAESNVFPIARKTMPLFAKVIVGIIAAGIVIGGVSTAWLLSNRTHTSANPSPIDNFDPGDIRDAISMFLEGLSSNDYDLAMKTYLRELFTDTGERVDTLSRTEFGDLYQDLYNHYGDFSIVFDIVDIEEFIEADTIRSMNASVSNVYLITGNITFNGNYSSVEEIVFIACQIDNSWYIVMPFGQREGSPSEPSD